VAIYDSYDEGNENFRSHWALSYPLLLEKKVGYRSNNGFIRAISFQQFNA